MHCLNKHVCWQDMEMLNEGKHTSWYTDKTSCQHLLSAHLFDTYDVQILHKSTEGQVSLHQLFQSQLHTSWLLLTLEQVFTFLFLPLEEGTSLCFGKQGGKIVCLMSCLYYRCTRSWWGRLLMRTGLFLEDTQTSPDLTIRCVVCTHICV